MWTSRYPYNGMFLAEFHSLGMVELYNGSHFRGVIDSIRDGAEDY